MDWINENAGVILVVVAVLVIALLGVALWLLFTLRSKIAVQKLNFLGFYSVNTETRESYANLTIGNRSLNDVGIAELGIRNGKVNFSLTEIFKRQKHMKMDARVVIEQRSAVNFTLTNEQLKKVLVEKEGKKQLKGLYLYAVDLTGTLYRGRISAVRKLLAELLAAEKKGIAFVPSPQALARAEAEAQEKMVASVFTANKLEPEEPLEEVDAEAETIEEQPAEQSEEQPVPTEDATEEEI